jgi:hypothetical protein
VTDVSSEWILEYRQKRPGLKVLQQQIDEFITAHEEKQEQVCIFHLLRIQGSANLPYFIASLFRKQLSNILSYHAS